MLREVDRLRAAMKTVPDGAHYIVNRKLVMLEQVLCRWLEDQRNQNTPVNGKMLKKAAAVTYTVLEECHAPHVDRPYTMPSFSASWFDAFMKRYRISYCQLHGEAGSVDPAAIEPELVEIRALTALFHPRNIVNCDETGFYLKELDDKSYTTNSTSGAKANRSSRVSILFCINADGSSIALAETIDAFKPLVLATSHARGVDKDAQARMVVRTTDKGWMTGEVFMEWLQTFDDQLSEPTLLLLDSCPAHNNIDMRDSTKNISWKHLHIRRLPKNSTSVTQPLDVGVISVFKRAFLEILSQETHLIRDYDKKKCISNGQAWSLIPHAWNRVKAKTLRNCFANTPVLPEKMRQQLRAYPASHGETILPLPQSRPNDNQQKERAYFEHLIAKTAITENWQATVFGTKDAQELLEEADNVPEAHPEEPFEEDGYRSSQLSDGFAEPASSPVEWEDTLCLMENMTGEHDAVSVKGLQEIRNRMVGGSEQMLEVRRLIKQLARAASAARKAEEVPEEVPEDEYSADVESYSDLLYSPSEQSAEWPLGWCFWSRSVK